MGRCEHGLTSKECYVCASPKYGENSEGRDTRTARATPHGELISQLLDSRVPKTEREHAAGREIERLRMRVDELEALLREVSAQYTRDDDLPDGLLPRIDDALGRKD